MSFFDIENIAFTILNYPVSYIELLGTIFGLLSVYYASVANIWTWPTGLVNVSFFFVLFYQIQLYADMFLQVYFFVVILYGWYNWRNKEDTKHIVTISTKNRIALVIGVVLGTLLAGYFFSNIHLLFPQYFEIPASFPYVDSLIMVCSIFATILLAQKKLENWHLWILVDIIGTILYFEKGVYFLALEYFIFLGLASYGLYNWQKQYHEARA